jgi:hypothetical protein
MYKSKIIERLVTVSGSESNAIKIMHTLGFSKKHILYLITYVPTSLEAQAVRVYLANKRLRAKCYYYARQLIKYDTLCLSLGIDAEFKNQKFIYDDETGKEILLGERECW